MKHMLLSIPMLLALQVGMAQVPVKKSNAKAVQQSTSVTTPEIRLESVNTYPAKSSAGYQPLRISDPTIRALNNRTGEREAPLFGSNSILGLPKGTYGYKNGQLWLRSTDATSIGGITGNSSVGTGSASGSVGTGGQVPGVNGKSPYSGPGIWGSAQRMQVPDSVLRRSRVLPDKR